MLEKYSVLTNKDRTALVFPAYDLNRRVVGYKECLLRDNAGKMEVITTNFPK